MVQVNLELSGFSAKQRNLTYNDTLFLIFFLCPTNRGLPVFVKTKFHHKIDNKIENLLDEMLEDEFENCKIRLRQPLDQFAKFQHFYASVRNH